MEQDEDLIFLTGDLGFGSFEVIQERFPFRFFNMGIAEQNMMGVACGLSLMGKKVVIYSIGNFSTLRVIEQIRNYPIYHQGHVLIVNGSGAFSYGQLGYTHHAIEDISMMKSMPHMRIFAPFDENSVHEAIDIWRDSKQTAYLRLEKGEAHCLNHNLIQKHKFGYLYGNIDAKNYILGYGTIIDEAIAAQEQLRCKYNIDVLIIIFNELKWLDSSLYQFMNDAKSILFLEENATQGGMGEHFFATCLVNNIKICCGKIYGVKDYISETIGDQKYLRNIHEIADHNIVEFFKNNDNRYHMAINFN